MLGGLLSVKELFGLGKMEAPWQAVRVVSLLAVIASAAPSSAPAQNKLTGDAAKLYQQAQDTGRFFAEAAKLRPEILPTSDGKSFLPGLEGVQNAHAVDRLAARRGPAGQGLCHRRPGHLASPLEGPRCGPGLPAMVARQGGRAGGFLFAARDLSRDRRRAGTTESEARRGHAARLQPRRRQQLRRHGDSMPAAAKSISRSRWPAPAASRSIIRPTAHW